MIAVFNIQSIGHPRYGLRSWLKKNFPYFAGDQNEKQRARVIEHRGIIMENIRQVLQLTYQKSGEAVKEYYKDDLRKIEQAYNNGDDKEFLRTIESLLDGIDWE